jgi:hypothetical protein
MTNPTQFSLGRNLNHDPRSRNFAATPRATTPRSVMHTLSAPVLDQGSTSSCTGNALAQCLNTDHFAATRQHVFAHSDFLVEQNALDLYSEATTFSSPDQTYPPNDGGSDGLSVCKAGQHAGFLAEYRHAFSFADFLLALTDQPVIVGTNWTHSMFRPDSTNTVSASGDVVGGHEYLALGLDVDTRVVTFVNSWGQDWGADGRFHMAYATVESLLADQGDVTIPVAAVPNPA